MTYRLIDTHCHFDFPPFVGNEVNALYLAQQQGINKLILPAVTADRFQRIVDLSTQYPAIYYALGLHPIYITQHDDDAIEQLKCCLAQHSDKLVALGEIGLDNYIDPAYLTRQISLLQQQLVFAEYYQLPVILHSRRTHELLVQQLKQASLTRAGVLHGFSGSFEQAQAFIQLGYYIGVGGVITYERAQKTRKAIARLPLSSLILETDAPDMPVFGFQGQPNRPEYMMHTLRVLSELRPEPIEEITEQIYLNTCRLFNFME